MHGRRATDTSSERDGTRSECLRFLLDGEPVSLAGVDPTRTVLEVLREDLGRTGTKEGCAEGDCGACTVVLGELDPTGERIEHRAVNACIQFAPTLDGKQLLTVESLPHRDGSLHPVQQAMVDHHGAQCGFCTPGIVMSLYALSRETPAPSRVQVDEALAGNLCRCTGYRPIVAAAQAVASYGHANGETEDDAHTVRQLRALQRDHDLYLSTARGRYLSPTSEDRLAELRMREPDAVLLAGGTDVGLWVTKEQRELPVVIYVGNVATLRRVQQDSTHLEIGAAVSIREAGAHLVTHYPALAELFTRFASPPIRNVATLGGNIVNGSPIGDSMPALMVLGTTLRLRRGDATREVALEDFYQGYRQNALQPGEFLTSIRVPLPQRDAIVRSYKVSKRFDQDISAICGAYYLELDQGRVTRVRIAHGGAAAQVQRAPHCEAALAGAPWDEASVRAAITELARDYTPLDDFRASAHYRARLIQNLLYRFFLESVDAAPTRGIYTHGR